MDAMQEMRSTTRGISLPHGLNERLVTKARQEDRPVSWVIRRALMYYFAAAEASREGRQGEVCDAQPV